MSIELLRSCDFDWVTRLDEIWGEWPTEDHFVHEQALQRLMCDVEKMRPDQPSPLGRVMTGKAGAGKTHLLRHLRRAVQQRGGFFFLIDGTDIRDFGSTLTLGITVSLLREHQPRWLQVEVLCYFLSRGLFETDEQAMKSLALPDAASILERSKAILQLPNFPRCPGVVMGPMVRALFYLYSTDPDLQEQATMWLQGVPLDEDTSKSLQLPPQSFDPMNILKVITHLCAYYAPVVIAFDQLDALITQHHLQEQRPGEAETESARRAREIMHGMGAGLMAIPDQTRRTLLTLSCLDDNWEILKKHMGNAIGARFRIETVALETPVDPHRPLKIVSHRIREAAQKTKEDPAPILAMFEGPFCDQFAARTPREILQAADKHRLACINNGSLIPFRNVMVSPSGEGNIPLTNTHTLSTQFAKEMEAVDVRSALGEAGEDRLGEGLAMVLPLLRYELALPDHVDLAVDRNFAGGANYPTLHARLRLIFRNEGDREFHICLRVLEKTHHSAFRARLNSTMIEAGIDRALPYRRLVLFRNNSLNFNGAATREMIQTFERRHGQWLPLPEETLRAIKVLLHWQKSPPAGFEEWLGSARPLSTATGLDQIVRLLLDTAAPSPQAPQPAKSTSPNHSSTPPPPALPLQPMTPEIPPDQRQANPIMVLGYRDGAERFAEEIAIPVNELNRHVLIRAGSGSGKTVLIKRLIENAALSGVSSVVLDPGNDLAQMAMDWQDNPASWLQGDEKRRNQLRQECDVVIYTPGRANGRPLQLPFLPDFSAVADTPDDLQSAVESAVERLAGMIASGRSTQAQHKRGILAQSFRTMAQQKRPHTLATLAEMFDSIPDVLDPGVPRAGKLIADMSGSLRAMLAQNPTLDATNHLLDWKELFGLATGRPRISVINFMGLPGHERQQDFVARLAESLFGWMRSHPSAGPAGLSGLLVLDEAKDFLPSQTSPPSKKPLMRLAAQARKYGVGLIVATQNPKDIDHNAVAQISTQYFGKANSPQVIEFIQKLLADKGAGAANPAQLKRGEFYLFSEAIDTKPQKVSSPICLTAHPDGKPLTQDDIIQLAAIRSPERSRSD